MSTEFELFDGKTLGGLFKDIYSNQLNKKDKISLFIEDVRKLCKTSGDMVLLGPIVKDLIETSVKNDEMLVKLATIAQRIIASNNKNIGDDGYLTTAEKEQLLKQLEDANHQASSEMEFDTNSLEIKIK